MTLLQAVVLGIVQGLTEFLPVSSSGHLVLFQRLCGFKEPMLAFDIAVHAGTLLAVLAFFHKDVLEILGDFLASLRRIFPGKHVSRGSIQPPHRGLWGCILMTLIPTGFIAIYFSDYIESTFSNLAFVAGAWLFLGILLILSERFPKGRRDLSVIHYGDAFWVGLAQGIALLPGISRSGSTILAGMSLGIKKEDAAKFSFLISIPAVAGAILMHLKHGIQYFQGNASVTLAGFFSSAITGYIVIRWLMGVIQRGRFSLFGYYCIAISLFAWAFLALS